MSFAFNIPFKVERKSKTPWITRISAGNGLNIGNVTDEDYDVVIKFRHNGSSVSEAIFGVYTQDNIYFRDGVIRDEKSTISINYPADNSAQILTFSRSNGTKSFSSSWGQSSSALATFTRANWWSLFSYYYGVYPFYGSISSCKIISGGTVIKDLVAKAEGEKIGFFDSVSGSFIELPNDVYKFEETFV